MPKVTIACLCYNHADFVADALQSVIEQTFKDWELIVVDDASADNSKAEIEQFVSNHRHYAIRTIFLDKNVGNCKAFNKALTLSEADYIIDFAADDILLPERIELGVAKLDTQPEVAINFTNANYINASAAYIKTHYPVNSLGKATTIVPEGDVFEQVIKNYFICSPTMMYRSAFLKAIGGYDETLAYEDFDLKIRLSSRHKFSYTDEILVHKRLINSSMSKKQYKFGNKQLASTLSVCKNIFNLISKKSQKKALLRRIAYESKQALFNFRWLLFVAFVTLGIKTLLKK